MARRSKPTIKQLAQLGRSQLHMGIDRLEKVIARIRQFDPQSVTQQYDIPLVDQLSAATDDALVRTFGPETIEYERYSRAARFDNGPHNYAYRVPIEEVWQSLARSKATNIALLEQAVGSLKERLAEEEALSQPEDPDFALWSEPTPLGRPAALLKTP
jgi:hypothetical protein